jgi:CheY-like chemotaxis protein/tRNA A-37 threonylcarbamoyl transferase component Bud32
MLMTSEGTTSEITSEQFLQNLRDAGLSPSGEIRVGTGISGTTLAQQLVASGTLTHYQADAIVARRLDDLVIGNYEILDRLGAGGMGTVLKARHRRMKRVVALKVLSSEVAKSEAFAQRFQREVETIARLSHPNIVMAFDADEGKCGPFLVMEFVNGRDLASEVTSRGALSVGDTVDCILQAARGLEYAHSQGIVHRDIKPANLMRDVSGTVKVADLGLARLNSPGGGPGANTSLTQAGGIVGTMDYISPEQAMDSTSIDQRADIYSLGCTIHFLLTARAPYEAGSIMALLLKHREASIPSLCTARPETPPELDVLFRRMLAKRPEDRPTTMTEVADALAEMKRTVRLGTARPAGQPQQASVATNLTGPTVAYTAKDATAVRVTPAPGLAPSIAAIPDTADVARIAGCTVVLAEPSRTQSGIFRRYLQQLHVAAIHAATTGHEAIDVAKKEGAHLILSAMHLEDMTGVQLAQTLMADSANTTGLVLATSETDTREAAALLPKSSRVVLMTKPFDLQRLAEAMAKALG